MKIKLKVLWVLIISLNSFAFCGLWNPEELKADLSLIRTELETQPSEIALKHIVETWADIREDSRLKEIMHIQSSLPQPFITGLGCPPMVSFYVPIDDFARKVLYNPTESMYAEGSYIGDMKIVHQALKTLL